MLVFQKILRTYLMDDPYVFCLISQTLLEIYLVKQHLC